MIKLSINVKKLDTSRVRVTEAGNEFLTILLQKKKLDDGYEFALVQAPTVQERKSGVKPVFVGKAKSISLGIADDDKEKFYMLFAEGQGMPTKKYTALKDAIHQAHYLATKIGVDIYVLEVSGVVGAKINEKSQV